MQLCDEILKRTKQRIERRTRMHMQNICHNCSATQKFMRKREHKQTLHSSFLNWKQSGKAYFPSSRFKSPLKIKIKTLEENHGGFKRIMDVFRKSN